MRTVRKKLWAAKVSSSIFFSVVSGLGIHVADNLWLVGAKVVALGSNSAQVQVAAVEQKPGTHSGGAK